MDLQTPLQALTRIFRPVNYEVTCGLKKLGFERIRDTYVVTESDMQYAKDTLKKWEEYERTAPLDWYKKTLDNPVMPTREECIKYLESIEPYHRRLRNFEEKIENCYVADFWIQHVGSRYDQDVHVHVTGATPEDDAKFKLYESLEKVADIPEKPSALKSPFVGSERLFKSVLWGIRDGDVPDKWQSHSVTSASIHVVIGQMLAGTGTDLTYGDPIIQLLDDEVTLKYWIASKETRKPRTKLITLKKSEAKEAGFS